MFALTLSCNRVLLALLFMLLLSCGGGGGSSSNNPPGDQNPPASLYQVPTNRNDGWSVAHLDDEGIDSQRIESMLRDISNGQFTKIDSVALVRHERLVLDKLFRTQLTDGDRDAGNNSLAVHNVYSVTKSINSALMGIALDKGYIHSVEELVYDQFPQYVPFAYWDNRKATTSIRHFLTMQHGLEWDELSVHYGDSRNSFNRAMDNCHDWVECLLDLPTTHEPGTFFAYCTHASLTLGAIVEDRSGMQLEAFARQNLFEPLGITEYSWGPTTPTGRARAGSGLLMTSRDMAKFGQLYLNGGRWQGQQLVSEAWVAESLHQHVTLPGEYTSTGYGYQWWLGQHTVADNTYREFHAVGFGGQYIFVLPELDLIVVFTGSNYEAGDDPGQPLDLLRQYILPAVVESAP